MTTWRVVDIIQSSADYLSKKGVPNPRLDAEILLGKVIQKERLELYLFFDRPMAKQELDHYREFIRRRGEREPLQHILGETGFMNLILKTGPQALIPRPETEVLVEQAIHMMQGRPARILDIGTGSGCIAIALAADLPDADVQAIDLSEPALSLARENAHLNHTEVSFSVLDIMKQIPDLDERFGLVVSNPPYISPDEKQDLQEEVRDFDPPEALFDDVDGLSFYRRFAEIIPELLEPRGRFLFEFGGNHQEKSVLNIFTEKGYADLEIIQDYNGDPRVISGSFLP
ncbi:MAG: peptide chain release factor N(5)-glutamine methyltransferase [Candidatus Marinimicrobia bacterium]|nr:peptide chain release factor N(5)-glutamine methyltransferase [Candidatus Neomarinimicrobiota bacterium]MCF7903540.1 peptide chain release factor N(5)-glutamine methyltransferase [Candidatus Neomarinimicrobiota bacterium]